MATLVQPTICRSWYISGVNSAIIAALPVTIEGNALIQANNSLQFGGTMTVEGSLTATVTTGSITDPSDC